jgi:hypothetical protein
LNERQAASATYDLSGGQPNKFLLGYIYEHFVYEKFKRLGKNIQREIDGLDRWKKTYGLLNCKHTLHLLRIFAFLTSLADV